MSTIERKIFRVLAPSLEAAFAFARGNDTHPILRGPQVLGNFVRLHNSITLHL
jgi:hypothetical protein